jgi:hypothetical protein
MHGIRDLLFVGAPDEGYLAGHLRGLVSESFTDLLREYDSVVEVGGDQLYLLGDSEVLLWDCCGRCDRVHGRLL